jgi:hypothetical protein
MHVGIETSQAERHAGVNVSYEASFTAIKNNIQKVTVDTKSKKLVPPSINNMKAPKQ